MSEWDAATAGGEWSTKRWPDIEQTEVNPEFGVPVHFPGLGTATACGSAGDGQVAGESVALTSILREDVSCRACLALEA